MMILIILIIKRKKLKPVKDVFETTALDLMFSGEEKKRRRNI